MIAPEHLATLIKSALLEDLGESGDITSQAIFSKNDTITATLTARENGIIAGLEIAAQVFTTIDPTLTITKHVKDGENVRSNQKIITVTGTTISILKAERTALNFLSHLSGIATNTHKYTHAISGTNAQILDTRKTLPAWRKLQKYAVKMGGGTNHRFGLYDMILIKDNHIAAAGGIKNAIDNARQYVTTNNLNTKIEVEVDTLEQLDEVLNHSKVDIVLLDNMSPKQLKKAVKMVDGKIKTEASGNITLTNIKEVAKTGVDYISSGTLTHSVKAFDFGLDI